MNSDSIADVFFRLPPNEQRVGLVSLLTLTHPRYVEQFSSFVMKAAGYGITDSVPSYPVRQEQAAVADAPAQRDIITLGAPADAARNEPRGGAPLGKNADFAANTVQPLPDAASREGIRAMVQQMVARQRPRKPKPIREHFPPGSALTPAEVCHWLNIGRPTLNRELRANRFPRPLRIVGRLRWRVEEIKRYLATLVAPGASEAFLPRGPSGRVVSSQLDMEMVALVQRVQSEHENPQKTGALYGNP